MATPQPRKSKLEPYLEKVGVVPDSEVATLAGVTTDAVRNFRKRRGIPAGWREESEPAAEEPAAVAAEPAETPEPVKAPRKRSASKPKAKKPKAKKPAAKKPAKAPRAKKAKAQPAPEPAPAVAPDAVVAEEAPVVEAAPAPAEAPLPEPEQLVEPEVEAEAQPAAEPPAAPAPKARSIRKPRKTKLDAYLDKLGLIPDKQLADLVGVTAENVRAYRTRRGIPARWRGEGEPAPVAAAPVAPAAPAPAKAKAKAKAKTRGGARRGKLTPFMDQIGIVPDARIAEMSGTTPANVRAFRIRHDIPARWRGEGEPLPGEQAAETPAVVEAQVAPATQPQALPAQVQEPISPAASTAASHAGAYMVTVEGPAGTAEYAAVGADIISATATAIAGMARARIEGKVIAVRFLATVLEG